MIVIGADPHKSNHCAVAVERATGELRSSEQVAACEAGHEALLRWGRGLDRERVWAIEDCRHVSGALERFLIARGERVVRVAPKLMAGARRGGRERGKSDPIDAAAVARAALREGVESLPVAHLEGPSLELRLLLDHREDLVGESTRIQNRLLWHLHDLDPALAPRPRGLTVKRNRRSLQARLARRQQCVRTELARELLRRLSELCRREAELEAQITALVKDQAPQLLELAGCGPLTAAKLVAECAGAERFASDAKLARAAGVAPLPASSGRRDRHRLDRGGNRQLNCAFHRIAVTQARTHPDAQAFLQRKRAEGKSNREALRCLKRHLVRRVYSLLTQPPTPAGTLDRAPALT